MDIQALMDLIFSGSAAERSKYHLTLGGLIEKLKSVPPEATVKFDHGSGFGSEMSYRGYYSDLAINNGEVSTAKQALEVCERALGSVYEGYKGGDNTMTETTPLWNAEYGDCGQAIVGARIVKGALVLVTKDVDL